MSYTETEVSAAVAAMERHRAGETGEVGTALVVVGLSAERTTKERENRDDMIRVAFRSGASAGQLVVASSVILTVSREALTAILSAGTRSQDCLRGWRCRSSVAASGCACPDTVCARGALETISADLSSP
jgi:hypothetical protein